MAAPWKVTAPAARGDGEAREVPEAGPQPAVCVGLIDLGTHEESYMGDRKSLRKVVVAWELTDQPMSGMKDANHVLLERYTLSFGKKANLRKMIEKWFGKEFKDDQDFDLTALLGQKAVLDIQHKESNAGNTFATIGNVSRPHKSVVVPAAKKKPFTWSIEDNPDDLPHWLPWLYGRSIKEWIKESQEVSGRKTVERASAPSRRDAEADEPADSDDGAGDDIPF